LDHHTPQNVVRGHHTRKQLRQIFVAVAGYIVLEIKTETDLSYCAAKHFDWDAVAQKYAEILTC